MVSYLAALPATGSPLLRPQRVAAGVSSPVSLKILHPPSALSALRQPCRDSSGAPQDCLSWLSSPLSQGVPPSPPCHQLCPCPSLSRSLSQGRAQS